MNIRRAKTNMKPDGKDIVRLKQCGPHYFEIRIMQRKPTMSIERIDADHYVDKRSGEVKKVTRHEKRLDDVSSIARSIERLRDLINTNIEDPTRVLWVTLTYASNMRDTKILYEDFKKFWKRLAYYLEKQGYSKPEYLAVIEPQGRGAWHIHAMLFFPENTKRPYIPNEDMARLWGQGFTKTRNLSGLDNPGIYLSAYLGDLTIEEAIATGSLHKGRLTETADNNGKRKAVVKGGRLHFYPAGCHMFRHSRGIKKPVIIENIREEEARKIIGDAPMVYEKSIEIIDEGENIVNKITYRQYNRLKKGSQGDETAE